MKKGQRYITASTLGFWEWPTHLALTTAHFTLPDTIKCSGPKERQASPLIITSHFYPLYHEIFDCWYWKVIHTLKEQICKSVLKTFKCETQSHVILLLQWTHSWGQFKCWLPQPRPTSLLLLLGRQTQTAQRTGPGHALEGTQHTSSSPGPDPTLTA